MSRTFGVYEAQIFAHRHLDFLRSEWREIKERRERLAASVAEAQQDERDTGARLRAMLLPRLDRPALEECARLTGLRLWTESDPLQAREEDRQNLRRRIAEIEQDERFVARTELVDPVVGSVARELAQAREDRLPMAELFARMQHPRMELLLEREYGTPRYDVPWWRLSYYDDWKAADEILERFPELHTGERYAFAEIRRRYLDVSAALAALREKTADLERRHGEVEQLVREHAQAQDELRTCDERHLERARARLADLLPARPPEDLGRRLAAHPEAEALAKRWSGLRAKLAYYDELSAALDRVQEEHAQRERKTTRDIVKLARPKNAGNRFTAEEVERRWGNRSAKARKFWERFDRGCTGVASFDRFERASWTAGFLWWDLMTDACPAPHVPSVVEFHRTHPDYRFEREADESAAAAAVAEAEPADEQGIDVS